VSDHAVSGASERPLAFPRDAVLTTAQVAAWLGKSEKRIYQLGIKRTPTGHILAGWVYDWMEANAA
jgi:hypothetical protein